MRYEQRDLIGNLTTDVELREFGEEKHLATFRLAVDRGGKDERDRLLPCLGLGPPGPALRGLSRQGTEGRSSRAG